MPMVIKSTDDRLLALPERQAVNWESS